MRTLRTDYAAVNGRNVTVEIPLTKGHVAIVDAEFAHLSNLNWYATIGRSGIAYAVRQVRQPNGKQRPVSLHRTIMNVIDGGPWVDHINGIGTDCRLENLRLCSRYENAHNRAGATSLSKTGVLGVSQQKGRFKAQITADGRRFHLGYFSSLAEAAAARLEAEKGLWGITPRRAKEFQMGEAK